MTNYTPEDPNHEFFFSIDLPSRKAYRIIAHIVLLDSELNRDKDIYPCEVHLEVSRHGRRLALEVLGDLVFGNKVDYVKKGPRKGECIDVQLYDHNYILKEIEDTGLVEYAIEQANREVLRQAGAI